MHNYKLLCVGLSIMALSSFSETIKGRVRLVNSPSLHELAQCYEKSMSNDPYYVAYVEIAGRYSSTKVDIPPTATAELRTMQGDKLLAKSAISGDGSFCLQSNQRCGDCRVTCRCEVGGQVYFGATLLERDESGELFDTFVVLRRIDSGCVSVAGRCVDTHGVPLTNVVVSARLKSAFLEIENEKEYYKPQFAMSDGDGRWRIDGVEKLSFTDLFAYVCNTNIFTACGDGATHPPYGIIIEASPTGSSKPFGCITVPNVTADDYSEVRKILDIYKQKTGKGWKALAPMKECPDSTNNVIYVSDIVLK